MAMTEEDVPAVLDRLENDGVAVSVAGGWAVDALLGLVTRAHGDLDLAVDSTLVHGAVEALGRIGGRTVRCLTPELLIAFHLGYEPRPIDRKDMTALARHFDVELPPPYQAERLATRCAGGA
jgi:hypothetical protein